METQPGVRCGQRIVPIARAGIYVPAGRRPLFSSLLMAALPAQAAGVGEIAVCSPPGRDGRVHPLVLAVAGRLGIGEVYRVGGAQAIAAMAYGTETVRRVDKVVGPGNRFVALAKKAVYGDVSPRQVSKINADSPKHPLGKTELIRWKSKDGLEIEGLLTYPVGAEKGRRYPLALIVHGGPAGVFVQSYIANRATYPIAAFAAQGWAVLRCNIRGSSGYGAKFRHANLKDWGGKDYRDLMAGVDRVIAMGVADPNRLGVCGWSYGGYMTSWIITQTKRFKAASIGAPVTNLMSFTGTADIPSFIPDYFGAEFWDHPAIYRDHSAMFKIKGATTPSLIQQGEQDVRVPIQQGYELYNALKRQGTTVKMVVYPRQPHGLQEPRLLLDAANRNIEWFKEYLK